MSQSRCQRTPAVIDDQNFSHGIAIVLQVPQKEFVCGIPRPQHLIRTSWITLEFELPCAALKHKTYVALKIGLEGLSNTIAGPDSEEAADKRAEDAGKGDDFSTPHYGKVASNARSDEEANVAEFLCIHYLAALEPQLSVGHTQFVC